MSEWTLIDEVAAGTPTPGGGAAAAYVGALGSALNSMVGNLTVGKKSYVDVEDQVKECLSQLQRVREELLALSKKDSEAFAPLAACFKMPRATEEEKAQARKDALKAYQEEEMRKIQQRHSRPKPTAKAVQNTQTELSLFDF